MNCRVLFIFLVLAAACPARATEKLTDYVNPFLGTATLWDKKDIGYTPTHRTWGGEVFPGASLPNAMVQLTPVTKFGSGSGYQYEDTDIFGFAHTCKGQWNLGHLPLLPATGEFSAEDYKSPYSHDKESARPGYYQVYLERYGIDAELTSTLRCAFHRYTFKDGDRRTLIANLSKSNEEVRDWQIDQAGSSAFSGYQRTGETVYFYAVSSHEIERIEFLGPSPNKLSAVQFNEAPGPLELRIGLSFVSVANAKQNLEHEMLAKSFEQVRDEATAVWEALLGKIQVTGGTERQRGLFYSCLYRSFLWPALRSDVNGDFARRRGGKANEGYDYYTTPSLWDDYRNKLVLMGMLSPDVTNNVIKSLIYRGEQRGFMPTFFHGDHAAPFIAGSYLRGLRDYDVRSAFTLLLRNATAPNPSRPHVMEYMEKGYVPEQDLPAPVLETQANAGVTKTLEYAYDDYAVALLAKELGEMDSYRMLMARTSNFKNVFDPATGLMRGRLADGRWIENFDPEFVFYEYMYREANAWQSSFFAPHDVDGLVGLHPSRAAFEKKLDELFSTPFSGDEAYNMSVFLGQYCHGNQPDHNFPFLYTFIDKQEKSQAILNHIMEHFYDMGKDRLAYAGMDDAGEMSAWYVFTAMGIYPFSPADPEYVISVPLFDSVEIQLKSGTTTIHKVNQGVKVTSVTCGDREITGHTVSHGDLTKGTALVIATE